MKKLTGTAIAAAALTLTLTLTGCNPLGLLLPLFGSQQPATIPTTAAAAPTTQAPTTTLPVTTAAPATQAPSTEAPTSAASPATEPVKTLGNARLVVTPDYTSDVLGITFHMPEWQNKVYAEGTYTDDGNYVLSFYEGTNLGAGLEKGYNGMGFLFSVFESDTESSGVIDYPAGSVTVNGVKKYLTYFKPTDVRFDVESKELQENYQAVYQYQREYFMSGTVRSDLNYSTSARSDSVNLKSE